MPRIEIVPSDWEKTLEFIRGDSVPTIDVCIYCANSFEKGKLIPDELENIFPNAIVGSTNVDHLPYQENRFECFLCGDRDEV